MPNLGAGSGLGIAAESTWGTPVSITNWLRITNISLAREISTVPVENLGNLSSAIELHREHYVETDFAGGSFEWNAAYDDSTVFMLGHIIGDVSTTGGGDPYSHSFTLSNPTAPGLTLENVLGDSTNSETFEGCLVASAEFSIEKGGIAKWSCTILAQTSAAIASSSSETLSTTTSYILHNQCGQAAWGGNNFDLKSLKVAIDNKLERRQLLGSALSAKPVRTGSPEVKITAVLEYSDDNFYTGFLAGTVSDFAITFTGTGTNTQVITAHNAVIMSATRPTSGRGVTELTVELMAFSDAVDGGLTWLITNANTTATAN